MADSPAYWRSTISMRANGAVSSHSAKVSTNGAWWKPISDAELGVWLTNWELGNDPVAPPPMLTGVKSDAGAFVPDICVECYVAWKAEVDGERCTVVS